MIRTHKILLATLSLVLAAILCSCRHHYDPVILDAGLLAAVRKHDVTKVRELLSRGAHPDATDMDDDTPLLIAARTPVAIHGNEDPNAAAIVELLLEKGANIEVKDRNGSTPLILAAESDNVAILKVLLQHGANIELANRQEETALTAAAFNDKSDAVEALLERTNDFKARDQALFAAIRTSPVVISGDDRGLPSHFADLSGVKTVKLLIERGANIEARGEMGDTPLIRATGFAQPDIVKYLLDQGANVEARDDGGNTALITGACGGCAVIDMGTTFGSVQLLLERGVNVHAKNKGGVTALMTAGAYGRTDIMKLLLQHGARVADQDHDGNTALILAAPSGTYSPTGVRATLGAIKLLLDHNSDINARNNKGQTALIAAVSEHNVTEASQVVRLLLSRGADISTTDGDGNTALMMAKKNGYKRAAKLLEQAASQSQLNPESAGALATLLPSPRARRRCDL